MKDNLSHHSHYLQSWFFKTPKLEKSKKLRVLWEFFFLSHLHTPDSYPHSCQPSTCFFGFITFCKGMEVATGGQRHLQEVQRQ